MKDLILLILVFLLVACNESNSIVAEMEGNKQEPKSTSSVSASQLYREANVLYEQGDIKGAQSKLVVAATRGDNHAKELLGFILLRESEVSDLKKGFRLVTEAAEGGLVSAQFYLGTCLYDDGCGIPENRILSAYWLEKALENGESGAEMLLSFLKEDSNDTGIDEMQYVESLSAYWQQLK